MNKGLLCRHLKVPQINVPTLGPHSQSGGMCGMPLQTGDPAVEGAAGAVEMIGGQRVNERLLETLGETKEMESHKNCRNKSSKTKQEVSRER